MILLSVTWAGGQHREQRSYMCPSGPRGTEKSQRESVSGEQKRQG